MDAMQIVGWVNALFILASVWLLASGEHRILGQWLLAGAATTGVCLGYLVGAWGLLIVNALLLVRAVHLLGRGH